MMNSFRERKERMTQKTAKAFADQRPTTETDNDRKRVVKKGKLTCGGQSEKGLKKQMNRFVADKIGVLKKRRKKMAESLFRRLFFTLLYIFSNWLVLLCQIKKTPNIGEKCEDKQSN